MASRRLISRENLLDVWGNTALFEWSYDYNPNTLWTMKADISDGLRVVAVIDRDHPTVISSSLRNLMDKGCISEVMIQYDAGTIADDSVTYLWDRNGTHPWLKDGTLERLD